MIPLAVGREVRGDRVSQCGDLRVAEVDVTQDPAE
jgi:hypothetical protein